MKITRISTRLVEVPHSDPLLPAARRRDELWPVVTIRLGTDEGVEGLGFAFSLGGLNRSLLSVLEELAAHLTGADPTRIEEIHARLRRAGGVSSEGPLFLMAQSAIDTALWDIRGKVAGLPLWRLTGGSRSQVPAYASGQIPRELDDEQAAEAAAGLVAAGFGRVKFHLSLPGDFSPRREIARARAVREAVGDEVQIGCDVNCRWRLDEALQVGEGLAEVGLSWVEDAIAHDDTDGMARLAARLRMPLMAGERNTGIQPFRRMLEHRSVGWLMIDSMMVGGITNWLKIAAMAEAFGVPVVSHLVPEIQAQLVGGVPNGLMAEHKSWLWALFEEPPAFAQGAFVLSDRPGLGLRFDRKVHGDDC